MRRLALALALLPGAAAAAQPAGLAHVPVVPEVIARTDGGGAGRGGDARRPTGFDAPEQFEARPGGAATSGRAGRRQRLLASSSANMSFERELDFKVGNGFFRKLWVTAPASTRVSDGLGPLFNARSCQSCHLKDGRGASADRAGRPGGGDVPAAVGAGGAGRPAAADRGDRGLSRDAARAAPMAGSCRTSRCRGCRPRGGWAIDYAGGAVVAAATATPCRCAGRAIASTTIRPTGPLDRRTYGLPARGAADDRATVCSRRCPKQTSWRSPTPRIRNGDGISGRPNKVWSEAARTADARALRGAKAGQPTIRDQAASAFSADIGISTTAAPGRPPATARRRRPLCLAQLDGGAPEADDQVLDLVTFYSRNLAVPARRDPDDPQVLAGKRVFYEAGCPGLPASRSSSPTSCQRASGRRGASS